MNRTKAFSSTAGISLIRDNQGTPGRGLGAHISATFNTGHLTGDIRRCFLSDATVESVSGPELVTNGDFSSADVSYITRGLSSVDGTWSVSAGQLVYTQGAGDGTNPIIVIPVTGLTVGRTYRFSQGVRSGTMADKRTYLGTGSSGSGGTSYMTNTATQVDFVATQTTVYVGLFGVSSSVGQTYITDNISLREVVYDRSYKAAAANITGTLTKAQLATGTSLVGYSGFSASNYLREPYSADLDFGTGEWTASAWVNVPATLPVANFPQVGSELIGSSWSVDGTSWTQSGANLIAVNGASYGAYYSSILVIGKAYKATFEIYEYVSGSLSVRFGNTGTNSVSFNANGTYTVVGQAAGNLIFNFMGGGSFNGKVRNISVVEVGPAIIADRAFSSGPRIRLGVTGIGLLTAEAYDGTTTRTVTTTAAYNTATWVKARVSYTTDGSLRLSVNGREVAATRGTPLLTLNNSSAVLTIGNSYALDAPFPGSIALLKLGATVPTPEQAQFMYEQEKQMFRAGAQSVLPDSGSIVDMAYDDATDRWIAVSAANESYWTGLVRNNVIAVPAGSYTKVMAASGVELTARSTTNIGVDITMPAYSLREELVKRAEAAARLGKELAVLDYVGGFTGNTTTGSTALTSVAGLSIPTSYIGAQVSGTGIPAGAYITGVSGTTIYISAPATANGTGVNITFLDFKLPAGLEAKEVVAAGAVKQEGSTKDYTRLYDGFVETIRFGAAPGATAWVQAKAQRITQ